MSESIIWNSNEWAKESRKQVSLYLTDSQVLVEKAMIIRIVNTTSNH